MKSQYIERTLFDNSLKHSAALSFVLGDFKSLRRVSLKMQNQRLSERSVGYGRTQESEHLRRRPRQHEVHICG